MSQLRLFLMTITALIVVVTTAAIANDGLNLLPHFFGPIFALTWQGQFNVDFATYLILSGVWMAWRGGFTVGSIALGILAPPLGILFFAPYLIYLIGRSGGDPKKLLLGVNTV